MRRPESAAAQLRSFRTTLDMEVPEVVYGRSAVERLPEAQPPLYRGAMTFCLHAPSANGSGA
jgi:hypothetical protein